MSILGQLRNSLFFFFFVQLVEVKSQLTRKTEVGHLQMNGKALSPEMEAAGNLRRKRVSERV